MLPAVIRRQIVRSVPSAGVPGVQFNGLDGPKSDAHLPGQDRPAHHLGAVYAGVLFALCESACGAAPAGA